MPTVISAANCQQWLQVVAAGRTGQDPYGSLLQGNDIPQDKGAAIVFQAFERRSEWKLPVY